MRRGLQLTAAALATTLVAAAAAGAAPQARFTVAGTVSQVVDGDTIHVVLAGGEREKVRLVGVDAAERGACYASTATAQVRRLALAKRVVLKGDAIQPTRDRHGRLLAYVWLPGGKDLGFQLVAGGYAKVYDAAFERRDAYRRAERTARNAAAGLWTSCATSLRPVVSAVPAAGCHPSYSPCLPIVADLDCADVRELGVAPVRVLGSDPYRLDGDDDGYGCE